MPRRRPVMRGFPDCPATTRNACVTGWPRLVKVRPPDCDRRTTAYGFRLAALASDVAGRPSWWGGVRAAVAVGKRGLGSGVASSRVRQPDRALDSWDSHLGGWGDLVAGDAVANRLP